MNKLKTTLVESFVGAIALGWVFATAIQCFANAFAVPWSRWTMRREILNAGRTATDTRFSLQDGGPDLIVSLVLLLVGYALLRWLYFKPLDNTASGAAHLNKPIDPQSAASLTSISVLFIHTSTSNSFELRLASYRR